MKADSLELWKRYIERAEKVGACGTEGSLPTAHTSSAPAEYMDMAFVEDETQE